MDRTVKILQENETIPKFRWQRKYAIATPAVVQDIEFAPNFLGLKLATIAADGILRIYEPQDPTNIANWGTPCVCGVVGALFTLCVSPIKLLA